MADRDLSGRIVGSYSEEYEQIKRALNRALDTLNWAMWGWPGGRADHGGEPSGQCRQSVSGERGERAGGSLEEVSSALQELRSMTRQNASNAKEAQELAEGARLVASRGVGSMRRLVGDGEDQGERGCDGQDRQDDRQIAFQTICLP